MARRLFYFVLDQTGKDLNWEKTSEDYILPVADQIIALFDDVKKQERDRVIHLTLQAISDEPEYPGEMPLELWEDMNVSRENITQHLRLSVRLTKNGITDRFIKALKEE